MNGETIKEFRAMIGEFQHQVKSNSVTDLVVWLECRNEYDKKMMNAIRPRK